ncbi:MAG TPA: glucuronate isomerase [Candidatus Hydrogenedentes bacterium]|nr:glucuronate isomerase [Candidatus Hydrogenedentota bacterium]HNT87626.1 glucuronate isomerase [Candidatus Hydrogenedentota bacterium]
MAANEGHAGNEQALRDMVKGAVARAPVTDIHTHLYAPAFGPLLLWGIDEVITYHYLIAEFFRASDMPYDTFWALGKRAQADAIWKTLFLEQTPLSEACRGVITVLRKLGLDVASRDLDAYRAWFAAQETEAQVNRVFGTAGLQDVVMTNDPFDDAERPVWERAEGGDARFHAALRIDPLLNDWKHGHARLQGWGYQTDAGLSPRALAETRRFLEDWARRMNARYMAVSLPPDFAFPEDSPRAKLIAEAVLPVARERNIPFAMMIGVTRQVNPALRLAGDGVGTADVTAVERLCAAFPKNKFMLTMLARENQHACCVAARKFRNLLVFGCWWFLNDPILIEEITRMRLELIGPAVIPQHSDARVLEQVIYKWDHSREIIARVLADKYCDLSRAGWAVTEEEVTRDVADLFGGRFWRFLEYAP